jgi:hypothetical protein
MSHMSQLQRTKGELERIDIFLSLHAFANQLDQRILKIRGSIRVSAA